MSVRDRTFLPPADDAAFRRIVAQHVLDYRDRVRHDRDRNLDELADLSDEAGLYDDDVTRTRLLR